MHADTDEATDLRGVVAADGATALFAFTQVQTAVLHPPGRFTVPGLEPDRRYTVRIVAGSTADGPGQSPLAWAEAPPRLTGRQLATAGLRAPVLHPGQLVLLELTS